VIVIIDPDFLFQRQLDRVYLNISDNESINARYGIGDWWENRGESCTFCNIIKEKTVEERDGYHAGVPNIIRLGSLKKVLPLWIEHTKFLRSGTKGWSEEQMGYPAALATLNFKTTSLRNLMVSLGEEAVAYQGVFPFIHYCQHYGVKDYVYNKHKYPTKDLDIFDAEENAVFTCRGENLPKQPPFNEDRGGTMTNSFMIFTVTRSIYAAWEYWKQLFCKGPVVFI